MSNTIRNVGFWSGITACVATVAFVIVQLLQIVGVLTFPADEILIYGSSLCIAPPLLMLMLAFHHVSEGEKRFWTQAALLFMLIYAVFVVANYVVQLATVIPAKIAGTADAISVLDQTPHSMFWNYDAIGYITMGIAVLLAIPALDRTGFARWVRYSFIAHAVMTPIIAFVYFYPTYSIPLLFLGFPWAITAPLFMAMLALLLRKEGVN
ncbi:MAG: hypothetical protein RL120_15785 [Gammaproteobacteria bacterium]